MAFLKVGSPLEKREKAIALRLESGMAHEDTVSDEHGARVLDTPGAEVTLLCIENPRPADTESSHGFPN